MAKLNRLGYKNDQKGILRRYYREQQNWASHLQNSKEFILRQTANFVGGKVAILGSGWLLDVPINELQERFDEVWLFDIHHPSKVRRMFSNNPKIKFIQVDLNNNLSFKAKNAQSFNDFMLQLSKHTSFSLPTKFEFVVSLNLLNQLDIILCDYLKKRFNLIEEQLIPVRQIIQKQHMQLILDEKGCLISDCVEQLINDNNEVVDERELIFTNLPEEKKMDSWIWVFDTQQYYHQKYNTSFKVKAFSL